MCKENLELYEKVRQVPDAATKQISGGRLKGMTDIKPMWRIKKLTEVFGPCGFGWYPEIIRTWLENGANGEITANVEIKLYVYYDGEWSKGFPGIGGSKLTAKESGGIYTDDECFKKAFTDALSVACKLIGMGADVYWSGDPDKYSDGIDSKPDNPDDAKSQGGNGGELPTAPRSKFTQVTNLIKDTSIKIDNVKAWIIKKFGSNIKIDNLTDDQFNILVAALKSKIAEE